MCQYCHRCICPPACPNYEPKKVGSCEDCGEPIYEGDDIIEYNGESWHEDCFWEKHHRTAS